MSERNLKNEEKQKLKEKWALRSQGDPTRTVWVQPELFKSSEAHTVFWSLTTHILGKLTRKLAWAKCLSVRLKEQRQGLLPWGKAFNQHVSSSCLVTFPNIQLFFHTGLERASGSKERRRVSSSCLAWFMSRFCPCKITSLCWWQTEQRLFESSLCFC